MVSSWESSWELIYTEGPEPSMGPKYPIVDPVPSFGKVSGNFSQRDYMIWGGVTGVSVPVGYLAGGHFRKPSAFMFGLVGCLAGYFLAVQQSYGRLAGYLPNDREVEAARRSTQTERDEGRQDGRAELS